MENNRTVYVESVDNYPALKMVWKSEVDKADLAPAFQAIKKTLNASEQHLYVIVDLRDDPEFPIVDTVVEALRGPFRHRKLAEWLVCDANYSARWIGSLLSRSSGRDNIRWFNTMDDICAYLETVVEIAETR